MATYRAQDLANRVINTEPIRGVNSIRESFEPVETYAYDINREPNWDIIRNSNAEGVYNNFRIENTFSPLTGFNLTRTGVQYNTTAATITPVGLYVTINIDEIFLPVGGNLKIRAYKGRPQGLGGVASEMRIPFTTGYIPYSSEITIGAIGDYTIYLNSLATTDLIAEGGSLNLFILGEFDYNDVDPTESYILRSVGFGGVPPELTLFN
jgi:hypothetical protein